jgi:hypothetical protein
MGWHNLLQCYHCYQLAEDADMIFRPSKDTPAPRVGAIAEGMLWRDATRLKVRKQNSNQVPRGRVLRNRLGIKSVLEMELKESEVLLSATEQMIEWLRA